MTRVKHTLSSAHPKKGVKHALSVVKCEGIDRFKRIEMVLILVNVKNYQF